MHKGLNSAGSASNHPVFSMTSVPYKLGEGQMKESTCLRLMARLNSWAQGNTLNCFSLRM